MSRMACTGGTRSWLASRPSAETRRRSPRSFRGGGATTRARASSDADDAAPRVVAGDPPRAGRTTRRALITLTHAGGVGAALARVDVARAGAVPGEWGYADSATGPLRWGDVRDAEGALAFPQCGCAACAQSPIDIVSASAKPSAVLPGSLADVLAPDPASRSLSFDVFQKHGAPNYILREGPGFGNPGALVLDGVPHRLASLHFHTPAENKIDGVTNAMEMHLVHVAADGSDAVAVVGVLFRHARPGETPDPASDALLAKLASDGGRDRVTVRSDGLWDPTSGYYRWEGSLTTPPCTGGVRWVLQEEPRAVDPRRAGAFFKHVGNFPGNARPTQPMNGRTVRAYRPSA